MATVKRLVLPFVAPVRFADVASRLVAKEKIAKSVRSPDSKIKHQA